MSNINLVLSNAIGAARGDVAAVAATLCDGLAVAFEQLALHGQKTPFANGIAALKGWRGELATTLEQVTLAAYQSALSLHQGRDKVAAKAATESFAVAVVVEVEAAYAAETKRKEAKRAEGKAKREAAKLASEAAEKAAATQEAADLLNMEGELGKVRTMLSATIDERDAAVAALAAAQARISELEVLLAAAQVAPTARTAKAKAKAKAMIA